jgi:hypothetical protein
MLTISTWMEPSAPAASSGVASPAFAKLRQRQVPIALPILGSRPAGDLHSTSMSSRDITDALVAEVVSDLRTRYALDEDDVRVLGERIAAAGNQRQAENVAFARRFMAEHAATFDRLSK